MIFECTTLLQKIQGQHSIPASCPDSHIYVKTFPNILSVKGRDITYITLTVIARRSVIARETNHRSGYTPKTRLSTGKQTFRSRITLYRATYLMKITK